MVTENNIHWFFSHVLFNFELDLIVLSVALFAAFAVLVAKNA